MVWSNNLKTNEAELIRMVKSDKEESWKRMIKIVLKQEMESLIFTAQQEALRTNYTKCRINKTLKSGKCGICAQTRETL